MKRTTPSFPPGRHVLVLMLIACTDQLHAPKGLPKSMAPPSRKLPTNAAPVNMSASTFGIPPRAYSIAAAASICAGVAAAVYTSCNKENTNEVPNETHTANGTSQTDSNKRRRLESLLAGKKHRSSTYSRPNNDERS
eukprot:4054167-Pleurochrysis_carterae.AAC.1